MTEVRKHGVKAKHMSTGERSMLSAFQESAQAIQDQEVGAWCRSGASSIPLPRIWSTA